MKFFDWLFADYTFPKAKQETKLADKTAELELKQQAKKAEFEEMKKQDTRYKVRLYFADNSYTDSDIFEPYYCCWISTFSESLHSQFWSSKEQALNWCNYGVFTIGNTSYNKDFIKATELIEVPHA
jgi:hypothetical protein